MCGGWEVYNGMEWRNVCLVLLFCECVLGVCCDGGVLWVFFLYFCLICKRVLDFLCVIFVIFNLRWVGSDDFFVVSVCMLWGYEIEEKLCGFIFGILWDCVWVFLLLVFFFCLYCFWKFDWVDLYGLGYFGFLGDLMFGWCW